MEAHHSERTFASILEDEPVADDDLRCPSCNTDEHLVGTRDGDVIHITCTRCELTWERDPSPRCEVCGTRDDVQRIPKPFIEKARGTQLSITGMQVVYRCHDCDRQVNAEADYRHIPPGQHPAK